MPWIRPPAYHSAAEVDALARAMEAGSEATQDGEASPGVRTSGGRAKVGRLLHGYHWGTAWRDLIHDQDVRV
jgi:hypothetical protein